MYLIFKILHVVAVISWMAGLLYLPRLFVYHTKNISCASISDLLSLMEFRLYKYIMYPAMFLTWTTGIYLVIKLNALLETWFVIKFFCIISMTTFHFFLGHQQKQLANKHSNISELGFRYLNEVPTVLMIVIVIMVVVRPF